MTAHNVMIAFAASQQNLSRLAYRTAIFQRMQNKRFPKNEDAIFTSSKPKRQTVAEQYRMAKVITRMMH